MTNIINYKQIMHSASLTAIQSILLDVSKNGLPGDPESPLELCAKATDLCRDRSSLLKPQCLLPINVLYQLSDTWNLGAACGVQTTAVPIWANTHPKWRSGTKSSLRIRRLQKFATKRPIRYCGYKHWPERNFDVPARVPEMKEQPFEIGP